MSNIYLVPGLFGSAININGIPAWPETPVANALATALQLLSLLRCNPDGTSQYSSEVVGLQESYHGIQKSLNATALTYDWRMAPATCAQSIASKITTPGWIVAHSYGGPTTLNLYRQLKAENQQHNIQGIIFLACPMSWYTSNYTAYNALNGVGDTWDLFITLATAGAISSPLPAAIFNSVTGGSIIPKQNLLSLLASWDSFGYLLPTMPTIRSQEWWDDKNVYVTQQWLQRGLAARMSDMNYEPPNYWNIYGTGFVTANSATGGQTLQGDDSVCLDERLPDAFSTPCNQTLLVNDDHEGIMNDPLVISTIQKIVAGESITGENSGKTVLCGPNNTYVVYTAPPIPSTVIPFWLAGPAGIVDP